MALLSKEEAFAFESAARAAEGAPQAGERVVARHRTWEDALDQACVLLKRLEVPDALNESVLNGPLPSADPLAEALGDRAPTCRRELRSLLAQLASDVVMNAGWYQAKTRETERQMRWLQAGALVCVLAIVLLFGALAFQDTSDGVVDTSAGTIAQISLFGTLFFGMLKALAATGNTKRQLTAFWEAGADLKEALYTFEHAWKGRLTTVAELTGPDFTTALHEELRNARGVVRKERVAFFEAFAAPEDVFTLPTGVLSEAASASTDLAQARAAAARERASLQAATAQDIAETRKQLIEAKAKLAAREMALAETKAAGLDTAAQQAAVIEARADVEEASRSLRLKLKVARLNPE